jgi:hypothetical protein
MNAKAIFKSVTITSGLGVGAVCYFKADEIEKKLGKFFQQPNNQYRDCEFS